MDKKKDGYRYLATIADYHETFRTPSGQKVLYHLAHVHGIMSTSFVEGNQYATVFNEGGRNVVLQIMKKIKMDIKHLEKLLNDETKLREEDNVNY